MGWEEQRVARRHARVASGAWALLCITAATALAQPGTLRDAQPAASARGESVVAGPDPGASAVEEVESLVRAARFEEALARADAVREELEAGPAEGEGLRLRVRLEVAAGTANVALERADAARRCFRRALAAEPALDLDPAATAPKVLRAFRSARAEPRAAQ